MITSLILLLLSRILFKGTEYAPDPARIAEAWNYVQAHDMDQHICIMVDYGVPSGCSRLWVWDFDDEETIFDCPVAHGRGRHKECKKIPQFSNEEDSWMSSLGKCRIGERYKGRFGIGYRLDGLDESNSNMRKRSIVLHGHKKVPEKPTYPLRSGTSRGCVMVATKNMEHLDKMLADRPNVLLYTYCNEENMTKK